MLKLTPERTLAITDVLEKHHEVLASLLYQYIKLDNQTRTYANERTAERTKRRKARLIGFIWGACQDVECHEDEAEQFATLIIDLARKDSQQELPPPPVVTVTRLAKGTKPKRTIVQTDNHDAALRSVIQTDYWGMGYMIETRFDYVGAHQVGIKDAVTGEILWTGVTYLITDGDKTLAQQALSYETLSSF